MGVLAGGNADAIRLQSLADGSMSENIVWRRRLLNEPDGTEALSALLRIAPSDLDRSSVAKLRTRV